ncbi:MAG: isoleucine--tRNA ligase [bacterium]|nr:isoleucine--tRNA ligase [bacterium]
MNYSKTLNLPKTSFQMKANLKDREPEMLSAWKEKGIERLIREKRSLSKKYILHDGPPYANGHIHMGTALNKLLKDIIVKYKNLAGFDAVYVPGWDCHGLPIEHKIMETFPKGTPYSKIKEECRAYAEKFVNIQRDEFKRLGVFGDWERPYLTFTNDYIADTLLLFSEMVKKGFVYKDKKPVFWCKSCQTALAEAEVEYKEIASPAIYVKFPFEGSNLLIWTTTPWTLEGNLACALNPSFAYQEIEADGESLIIAKQLVEDVMRRAAVSNYKVKREINPNELFGKVAQHPYLDRPSKIIRADFVTAEIGAGCVHIAPGHGMEDYVVGIVNGLEILSPVNDAGRFTEGKFIGEDVISCQTKLIALLKERKALFFSEEILHSYPHCWRCKKPIIFRATSQWFIKIDHNRLRERILSSIKGVEWIPEWGERRFTAMIENRGDWCISRQRAWGIPIPAFTCKACGKPYLIEELIEFVASIIRKEGCGAWFEKEVSELLSPNSRCDCGSRDFEKEADILDVWFDSGSSHYAVLKQKNELSWPADLYLEGSDQHRGWFQSSMLTSMAVFNEPPYKAVLTHGFMLDENGRTMSKSLGNVISPKEIIEKFGADPLRLWVASTDFREDMRLGKEILETTINSYRKIRNTIRFILANIGDFEEEKALKYADLMDVDKFLLSKLQILIEEVEKAYEKFEFHRVVHLIMDFCTKLLSNLYLDITKDRLYCEKEDSPKRRSAQTVLYQTIRSILPMIAPVLSFLAEEAWQYLKQKEESVFLGQFPKPNKEQKDIALLSEWEGLLLIRDKVNLSLEAEREKGLIGSSLEAGIEISAPEPDFSILKKYNESLGELFIVSSVKLIEAEGLEVSTKKAIGVKCQRCWIWNDSIEDELCPRCREVVTENRK